MVFMMEGMAMALTTKIMAMTTTNSSIENPLCFPLPDWDFIIAIFPSRFLLRVSRKTASLRLRNRNKYGLTMAPESAASNWGIWLLILSLKQPEFHLNLGPYAIENKASGSDPAA